jgi:hypothetical protein
VQTRRNYKLAGPNGIRIESPLPDMQAKTAAIRKAYAELA